MKKSFVMLAAPGMIGKSTAAREVCETYPTTACLENDRLMHRMFEITRLPTLPINEVDNWRGRINAVVDCNRLIGLLHRDWVACLWKYDVIVAEGFTYMLPWYRHQVLTGLTHLGYHFDFWLLQYSPDLDEQARRRAKKYSDWGWRVEPASFHIHEITEQWNHYEDETPEFSVNVAQVDDQLLTATVGCIAEQYL